MASISLAHRQLRRFAALAVVAATAIVTARCGEPRATTAVSRTAFDRSGSPSLLQCPSNVTQTTQAIVGVLGGTVQLGQTSISIPAGAVSLPTLITVTIPASPYMEIDIHANDLLSFVFN